MGLASFNRMRKVYAEAKKIEEAEKENKVVEEIPVVEPVEPEVKGEVTEEPTTTRRRTRRNQE